ncbi:BREX-1 system adenine-specific DNA-methyltransferase PglX [Rhizobium ruizarguesonis]|uniref:BREX-1 system adenine-specific DNA-methyltransferase PglX n=1 Tax=Rhizobium ruizarguesonis TaxID=2081791 RepID=UPI00102FC151|nr:BREX-1 system adenine-specific DNA-methyltransferase PglX [Rhizobium ruizarguesonis]TAW76196.1 BREX-1 system adenine-specific DNA-methyltransferase PglX [Rhizobium ruizarguesonis]TAX13151.1 BREX-1 system adenine-specific DNA-methyltransferase PglX [Rhizobium ruizarguesonis]TAX17982.1 BREX-1 system adenine-specific DNA-methyltransferase PglX [Rhizobium ruizarguesonis]
MDTNGLKKFAQSARNLLIDQVTAKLALVLDAASAARREQPAAVKALEVAIHEASERQVIEQVAYTWFNRFTALRFMDVNGYTNPRIVSPADGATRPEILAEAMAGNLPEKAPAAISTLLEGRTPSNDPQAEAYRLLLVHACNAWHGAMPFLFEKVGDYTELLMPADLLSPSSILARLREVMAEDACADVEIIGWLYQFYISEKKDQVFAGLKKNIKITAENIPAATQLFTPHWIVRYLVENSLGRLWLLNRPSSKLAAQMDYYIAPEEPETGFLKISKPEEIKICDPACGSGHMLTYAFDLLHSIYEEEGYDPAEIPALILRHNLTGIEIDDRAGALAAFALAMKAAAKLGRRRFLRMEVKPDVVVLQTVAFTPAELTAVAAVVGKDLFTAALRETLTQFEQAKNFGSLIVPKLHDPAETLRVVKARDFSSDLLLKEMQARVIAVLRMAEALSPTYHVVVANPPYMGASNANAPLKAWLGRNFANSKRDLFSAFVERNLGLCCPAGHVAMITMQNWMFISRFQDFRDMVFNRSHVSTMAHLGERAFDSIGGEVVSTTAFVLAASKNSMHRATFIRLTDGTSEAAKRNLLTKAAADKSSAVRYSATESDFKKIPGDPIAYWVSSELRDIFESAPDFDSILEAREGLTTGKNEDYVRYSYEVSRANVCRSAPTRQAAINSGAKWFPYNKGGEKRKWFGNDEFIVNWENDGEKLQTQKHPSGERIWAHNFNLDFIFRPSISWSDITTKGLSARLFPEGFIFDASGLSAFNRTNKDFRWVSASICNSHVGTYIASILNPTMHFKAGDFAEFPLIKSDQTRAEEIALTAVELARSDWDAYETSWDFTTPPLLSPDYRDESLDGTYTRLRAFWQGIADEIQRLEEENNRIFINAYGLQDELMPEVPIEEITLTCNPAYRYGVKGTVEEREVRLNADTMAEFLSYAVGCMFGRYSLDAPGLILANQGETLADYFASLKAKGVTEPSFLPDADNVIPVLDGDWFPDDIVDRFRKFLRVTFGEERFRENLAFIEAQIGDIRKYFTRTFFEDHLKRYKKRPIYWMFSSPKGTFQALIYMHRYRPETISVLLNDYLREFIRKLEAERARLDKLSDDPSAAQTVRTRALKDVGTVAKQIAELEEWERDVIFPLAQKKFEIDLDDGVKRNYPLFGAALKPIKGLEAADE